MKKQLKQKNTHARKPKVLTVRDLKKIRGGELQHTLLRGTTSRTGDVAKSDNAEIQGEVTPE